MPLALGALAGILSGLGGVPKGMAEGTAADQRQQQLDQQMNDVDQLYSLIGMPKPPGMGSGKVNTSTANLLVTRAQADQERQRKAALGTQLATQLNEGATTTSMAPGASVEMPQPGSMLTPPPTSPMPAMTERRVNPDMAALAKYMPTLAQLDPGKATELVAKQLEPQKPVVVPDTASLVNPATGQPIGTPGTPKTKTEFRAGEGDTFSISVDPKTGAPVGKPTPMGIGAPQSKAVYTRADIEEQLKLENLQPGTLQYRQRYNDLARQIMVPQGGTAFGAGTGMGAPPPAAPTPAPQSFVPPASPQGNTLRAQAAETTNPALKASMLEAATAADAAASAGTRPPAATPTGGGPRPLIERPPSAADAAHYVHKTTLQTPPAGMTLSQIQGSNEYINVGPQAMGAVKQYKTVKTMLDEADDIINRRPDLFPPNTAKGGLMGGVMDNAQVAQAWAKFRSGAKTDADIGKIASLKIALPTAIKAFGDTANVAVAEREIADQALGLGPMSKEAAQARISTIRQLANSGATSAGFPNLMTAPPAGGGGAGQGKVRVISPDGTRGTWDLSKGPIPPGFKQRP